MDSRRTESRQPAAFANLHALMSEEKLCDTDSLARFLEATVLDRIVCQELPIIRWSRECAARNDTHGLLALDQSLAVLQVPPSFHAASVHVGRQRLDEMASLRGHSFLKRYQAAVALGQAHGHNAVVYGIHLVVFSVPLREGLLSYAYQTLRTFAEAAGTALGLTPVSIQTMIAHSTADLPRRVEASLAVKRPDSDGAPEATSVVAEADANRS